MLNKNVMKSAESLESYFLRPLDKQLSIKCEVVHVCYHESFIIFKGICT